MKENYTTEDRKKLWDLYRDKISALAEKKLTTDVLAGLLISAEKKFSTTSGISLFIKNKAVSSYYIDLKMEQLNGLTEEEFFIFDSISLLKKALVERHGFNPLLSSQESELPS